MTNRCIVCDSEKASALYTGIVSCDDCGYIYADVDMTQEEFEALYHSDYFQGEEYSDYLADRDVLQKNFSKRLEVLRKYMDPKRHQSLLEVGCAYGFFLQMAEKEFSHVVGVDVTPAGVEYARQELALNAHKTDLLEWDFDNKEYDVVCLWDTIEHLRAPDKYLEKIAENTASGALLNITTGDIDSKMAKFRKNKWRLIHPPTHAHYFSVDSLTRLLDRYGFDVVHVEHCGFYRSVDNIAYNILTLRSNFSWLYNFLKKIKVTNWDIYSNMYDIMYIVARKR